MPRNKKHISHSSSITWSQQYKLLEAEAPRGLEILKKNEIKEREWRKKKEKEGKRREMRRRKKR